MMKVLIADDHAIVRHGLRELLADELPECTFGEACDGVEVLEALDREPWDLVLMDITMPRRGGIDVLRDLREKHPRIPVLVLSVHPEEQFAIRALKAGASGYLTKEAAPDELIEAVRKVLSGGRYVSRTLADRLAAEITRTDDRPPHETLSDREFQVLIKLASGQTVSQIAAELTLSVKTVSTYRSRILDKMQLQTNADLMRYAMRHQLVS
jgi:two-component system invasion response regulator UvrY